MGDDAVDERDGFLIEGHHAFGVQHAQRNFQPCTLPGDFVQAVESEADEFTDAQTGCSLQEQRIGGQPLGPGLQCVG